MDKKLAAQISRIQHDLAPYDETVEQARNTARLRNDPTYVERWIDHDNRRFLALYNAIKTETN